MLALLVLSRKSVDLVVKKIAEKCFSLSADSFDWETQLTVLEAFKQNLEEKRLNIITDFTIDSPSHRSLESMPIALANISDTEDKKAEKSNSQESPNLINAGSIMFEKETQANETKSLQNSQCNSVQASETNQTSNLSYSKAALGRNAFKQGSNSITTSNAVSLVDTETLSENYSSNLIQRSDNPYSISTTKDYYIFYRSNQSSPTKNKNLSSSISFPL